jgi:hypothetical protein
MRFSQRALSSSSDIQLILTRYVSFTRLNSRRNLRGVFGTTVHNMSWGVAQPTPSDSTPAFIVAQVSYFSFVVYTRDSDISIQQTTTTTDHTFTGIGEKRVGGLAEETGRAEA